MPTDRPCALVADSLDPDQLKPLRDLGVEILDRAGISAEQLALEIGPCQALLVRSRTKVTPDLLARAPALRVIGRAGTGVDNIDIEAATRSGVVVMNVPGGNAVAAAEHTIALMTALARSVPQAAASLRAGRWDRKLYQGTELTGKTLGVVGLGRIGREVAYRARGMRMRVLAYDPLTTAEVAEDLGIELRPLDELVKEIDFLSLHVPLSDATRHLVDAGLLASAKPGLRILNVARGGIVDEAALLESIEAGHVAGAALDVFESEPPEGSALVAHPAVISTPHLGASTAEAQAGVAHAVASQVGRYLTEGVIENAVNVVGLDPALREQVQPWADLARRLGWLASALSGDGIHQVDLTMVGEIASSCPQEALTTEVLMGLLNRFAGDRVNPVNAALFAEERGIRLSSAQRPAHKSFQSLLRVQVQHGDGSLNLAGTLFGTHNLRVVRAFGFNIDAIPEGPMLWCANRDAPGIIGHLGTVLADEGINIANMSVGRNSETGEALAVLNLDAEPSAEAIAALMSRDGIHWIRLVT